ncbi:Site-specific recombinase [Cupriavidus necator]
MPSTDIQQPCLGVGEGSVGDRLRHSFRGTRCSPTDGDISEDLQRAQTDSTFVRKEMIMETSNSPVTPRAPLNKGKVTGQKPPLKLCEIWAIRTRLQMSSNLRELALFNLAIDSKLRACDLTRLCVRDVCQGTRVSIRAMVIQQKTHRPVQFEITEQTRSSLEGMDRPSRIALVGCSVSESDSRLGPPVHTSVRQARTSLDRVHRLR